MTLDEARRHIGNAVVYWDDHHDHAEQGVVTSVNDTYVFVRYGSDSHSKATRPEDLTPLGGRS